MMQSGFLPRDQLHRLFQSLHAAGYAVIGPRVRAGAIVYATVTAAQDLPWGVRDTQAPAHYRLATTGTGRCFAWANGAQALKPRVFAADEALWRCERAPDGALRFNPLTPAAPRLAILGVRACDLAGLRLQDRHFLDPSHVDPAYAARRAALLLIGVHCTHPAATCFCASTGDGPRAEGGYDLALDELDDGYLVAAYSAPARAIVAPLCLTPPTADQLTAAAQASVAAAAQQTRRLPPGSLRAPLMARLEHERWADVAQRCLSCGNCTSVCPTCFCSDNDDTTSVDGATSVHRRLWGSCFNQTHSHIHGITIRADTRTRYRQWLVHKLATWHDQYGRSGCVGCGRCITWCPAGIDLTGEVAAVLGEDAHA